MKYELCGKLLVTRSRLKIRDIKPKIPVVARMNNILESEPEQACDEKS